MEIDQLLSRLAVALGIGLLIGLERGWKTREVTSGSRAAGIRTFALSGLLGGVTAALAGAAGEGPGAALVLGIGFAVFAAVAAVFERDANRAADSFSATTIVAAMLTFILGAYAVMGDMRIAAAAAVAATGILAAREEIHAWVAHLTWPELRSVLVLLAMTFIVLPVLPDASIGPGGGVNPRTVWIIAIALAGVSFVGYGGVKFFGATRGIVIAALAGGLVSSTAVTITNARRAAAGEGDPRLLAAGAAVATAISFLRMGAILGFLKRDLLLLAGPALLAGALGAAGWALVTIYGRGRAAGEPVHPPAKFRNPFSFWPVVGFAVFLGVVILLGRAIGDAFGSAGAVIGAIALGLADVDAVTVSLAQLVPSPLAAKAAAVAVLAAAWSNTLAKFLTGAAIARGRFAAELAGMTLAAWACAAAALWLTPGFSLR